jgi:hypothetical protein
MPSITAFLADARKLHISSNVIKVLGILGGVAFGVLGHDWTTGGEIAVAALASSVGVSSVAMKATPGITTDPSAIANVGKP